MKGITGENLLFLLERRLDNAVYRAGFSTSRRQARQLVNHGHVLVNGRKVDIPSYQVRAGEAISIKEGSRKNPHIESAWQTASGRGRPSWISQDGGDMSARIAGLPTRDDIDRSINEQLIVDFIYNNTPRAIGSRSAITAFLEPGLKPIAIIKIISRLGVQMPRR